MGVIPQSIGQYNPSIKCKISLLTTHGRFVSVDANQSVSADKWERTEVAHFVSQPMGNNKVALQSHNGWWLGSDPGGQVVCVAPGVDLGTLEVIAQGGKFGFMSWKQKLLSAQGNNALEWNSDRLLDCEEFSVIVHQILTDDIASLDPVRAAAMIPVDTDSEFVDGPPGYAAPPANDVPPAYGQYDDMIMPSAPTESFNGPPPGTSIVAPPMIDDYGQIIATAPTFSEGGGTEDEVQSFLTSIGKVFVEEYYQLFIKWNHVAMRE